MPLRLKSWSVELKAFVLPGELPFLLGIEAMRVMKTKVDLEENVIEVLKDKYQFEVNDVAHFIFKIDIAMDEARDMHVFYIASSVEIFRKGNKVIAKLHHNFGHTKKHELSRLIEHFSTFRDLAQTKVTAITESVVSR